MDCLKIESRKTKGSLKIESLKNREPKGLKIEKRKSKGSLKIESLKNRVAKQLVRTKSHVTFTKRRRLEIFCLERVVNN